jgi:DnaJ-class molecular chaperone
MSIRRTRYVRFVDPDAPRPAHVPEGYVCVRCNRCKGRGQVDYVVGSRAALGHLQVRTERRECMVCNGEGYVWVPPED